jgi:hypothetical protein
LASQFGCGTRPFGHRHGGILTLVVVDDFLHYEEYRTERKKRFMEQKQFLIWKNKETLIANICFNLGRVAGH